ncbi:MAG: MerR family transcriptional regulator [Clostridia bacterium]|nr:MerR family transcriptional regulator [Clostridia bacterium]
MSKYTTGEIAKLCGVSVRTVQYYDSRGILIPSELSDGGRRLYSEDDLEKLRVICFLRETGIPLGGIGKLFCEEHPEKVISILLDQQEQELREELSETQKKLRLVETIKRQLKDIPNFSVGAIGDIAEIMKQKSKLTKMRIFMILAAIPISILQWVAIILWITQGLWWLFALWVCLDIPYAIWISVYYFSHVAYICPQCHNVFRPRFKEAFWAYHTPKMRRLTCPECKSRGLCVEVYEEKENNTNG